MREPARDEQLIELLPADDAAWGAIDGSPSPAPANPDPPGPARRAPGTTRRTIILAGLAVTTLLVVATIAATTGDEAAGPTSTAQPTTTRPALAPTTSVAASAVPLVPTADAAADDAGGADDAVGASPYFVIADPALTPYSADVVTQPPADARFTIWFTPGASEPWLSVQVDPPVALPYAFVDSVRRVVGDRELVTPRGRPTAGELVVNRPDGTAVQLHGEGIDDNDLVALAEAVEAGAGDTELAEAISTRTGLTGMATGRRAADLLYGAIETQMSALTADGSLVVLRVASGGADARPSSLGFFGDEPVTDDEGYTAARLAGSAESIVTWAADDHLLSVTAPMPPDELRSVARRVRRASPNEWRRLLYGLHPDYRIGDFAALAGGGSTGAGGGAGPWQAGAQLAERGGHTLVLWWWTAPGNAGSSAAWLTADAASLPRMDTVVVAGATYVFVAVAGDDPAQQARVRASDGSEVLVPLTQPFPDAPVRTGAMRTVVPGELSVRLDEPVSG